MTAAQAAAQLLASRLPAGEKVLVVGGAGLVTAVRAAGYEVVFSADDEPAAVAQGFAPEVGWAQLAEAAYAIERGAWHVASNLDLSLPTARGFAPGNGSLVGAVRAATGVTPDSAGKPSPTMYHMAVERAGARETLVVGDRLDTDLAGARAGGFIGLHVLTGVNSARDDVLAKPGERPHLIGADLLSLLVAHPEPVAGRRRLVDVPGRVGAHRRRCPGARSVRAVERGGPGRRRARSLRSGVGGGRRRRRDRRDHSPGAGDRLTDRCVADRCRRTSQVAWARP